jgi:malic enzyme-like protein
VTAGHERGALLRLIVDRVDEAVPIVHTQPVGLAGWQFSHIHRCNRALFRSYPHRDRLAEQLRNRHRRDLDVIVVTDGAAAGVVWFLAHDVPGHERGICPPRRAGRQAEDRRWRR